MEHSSNLPEFLVHSWEEVSRGEIKQFLFKKKNLLDPLLPLHVVKTEL